MLNFYVDHLNLMLGIAAAVCIAAVIWVKMKKTRINRHRKRTKFSDEYLNDYCQQSGVKASKIKADKGIRGEFMTFQCLAKSFGVQNLFPNVYIETKDGNTTELDLVLLTSESVFVFEIKNYSGTIFGKEKEKYWIQRLAGKTYRFYNPIRQNEGHSRAISSIFQQVPSERIQSFVVFVERCLLRVNIPYVVYLKQLIPAVESRRKKYSAYFTQQSMQEMRRQLTLRSKQSDTVKSKHIDYVRSIQSRA